jgi:hypothetical protein
LSCEAGACFALFDELHFFLLFLQKTHPKTDKSTACRCKDANIRFTVKDNVPVFRRYIMSRLRLYAAAAGGTLRGMGNTAGTAAGERGPTEKTAGLVISGF